MLCFIAPDAEVIVTDKTTSVKKEKVTTVGEQVVSEVEMSPQFAKSPVPTLEVVEGQDVA